MVAGSILFLMAMVVVLLLSHLSVEVGGQKEDEEVSSTTKIANRMADIINKASKKLNKPNQTQAPRKKAPVQGKRFFLSVLRLESSTPLLPHEQRAKNPQDLCRTEESSPRVAVKDEEMKQINIKDHPSLYGFHIMKWPRTQLLKKRARKGMSANRQYNPDYWRSMSLHTCNIP